MKDEEQLINDLSEFSNDPLGYALYNYPCEESGIDLEDVKGPRKWQADILDTIGKDLRDGKDVIRVAVASGHGIGKSALISMIIGWGISTFEDTKVIVTANTDTQLKTKTWAEFAKWHAMALNEDWFDFNGESMTIKSKDVKVKKKWRCDMIPWSERNPQAFAGAHNKGKRLIILFDEASSIIDVIWETIEGALTDEDTQIIFVAFGNPTLNTGMFRECFRKFSHRWHTRQIDSREVEGTNKEQLQEVVDDWGENSDLVKVRIRGMFPSASAKQFISTEDVDNAYGKHLREEEYNKVPKIIACDPAWEGNDLLTIGLRQGLMSKELVCIPKNDNDMDIANILARYEDEYEADMVVIDMGYGTGIYSCGKSMNRTWRLVNSASTKNIRDCSIETDVK